MREQRTIDDLQNQGLTRFNSSSTSCSLQEVMLFCAKAMDVLKLNADTNFLFHEDHFDFLIADFRGNEYIRCVRVGESSIYSGAQSRFIVWGNAKLFKSIRESVNG